MLDEFRSTSITWDKATSRIYSPVTANASDENGRKLVVQIVNSGQVEDLTGAALHLYWETRDKLHDGLDVFDAVDLKKGEFELSYTTGMLSNKGLLNANLVLIDTVGRVVSERFKITVTEGIDNDAIQSENSFTTLTQALIDISNLEQNYAPRLNDLTAQLQQKADLADLPSSAYTFKGSTTFSALPTTGNTLGDVYYTTDNAINYSWTGTLWTPIGDGAFADGSVTSSKLADGSVPPQKTTFLTVDIGKNRYNENDADVLTDYQISTSGTIIPYATWSVTGHIPVSLGENLKASYNNNGIRTVVGGRWLAYDDAGNVLTAFSSYGTNIDNFTSNDSSIVSVRFSILSSRFVELQIEKGTTYSNFERYTETAYMPEDYLPTSAYIEPKNVTFMVESTGKNILNLNDDEVGPYALNADGTISYHTLRFLTGYIPLEIGESITVTFLNTDTDLRQLRSVSSLICFDAEKSPIPTTYATGVSQYTATHPDSAFVRICFVSSVIGDETNPNKVMIQKGLDYSVAKGSYEDYEVSYKLQEDNVPDFMTNLDFDVRESYDRLYAIENRIGFEWKPFDTGKIIFQLDDVNPDISDARDLFNIYNFPLSLACITEKMQNNCNSGETVTEVMATVEASGGEIFSHSVDPNVFTGVSQEVAEQRLRDSKRALKTAGFNTNGFISPQGVDMYPYLELVSKYYRYSYGGQNAAAPINLKLDRVNVKSMPLAELKTLIDNCATNKTMLILMCHTVISDNEGFSDIYPTWTTDNFQEILDYLKYGNDETKTIVRTDIDVTTVRDLFNQYGSI